MPEFRTRAGVEIARVGTYKLSTGPFTFTRQHLAAAIKNAQDGPAPRLKLGHVDKRFDGEPAIGKVINLRLAEDGDALVGDFADVPGWLDDHLESAYPGRSLEASATDGDLKISNVSLLGVTLPGITSLADLQSRFSDTGPLQLAAGEDANGLRIEVVIASNEEAANALGRLVDEKALPATQPSTPKEESDMDPKLLREKLGLAEDASAEDVTAAITKLAERPEPDNVIPIDQARTQVEEAVAAARVEEREKIAASGGQIIDEATLADLRAAAADGREARKVQITASRETYIDEAIRAGKFPPARRDHYIKLLAADETGTRELIDSLETGVIPVDETKGIAASETDGAPTTTGWFSQLQEA